MGSERLTIQFTNSPLGVFYPGSEMQGVISLELTEPLKARHITACVDGHAKNHWTCSESRSVSDGDGGTTTESETIHYSAEICYAKGSSIIWSSPGDSAYLPAGHHKFPFRFVIPINCPPSLEDTYGHIRYKVHVVVDRPWRFNKRCHKCFTVAPAFDLNTIPHCAIPMVTSKCEKTGIVLFRKGNVSLECRIPKSGFVPGEVVVAECTVDNGSSKAVSLAKSKIVRVAEFIAYRHGNGSCTFHNGKHRTHDEHRVSSHVLVATEQLLSIPPKSKGSFVIKLPVKATVPSFNCCPITKVDYFFYVKIKTEATISNTIENRLPLIIGTIPLQPRMAVPAAVPPSQSTAYPSLPLPNNGNGSASSSAYPSAPAELPQPGAQPNLPGWVPPPNYEEAVYGGFKPNSEELDGFLPRYPVYPNLDNPQPSAGDSIKAEPSAPPLKM